MVRPAELAFEVVRPEDFEAAQRIADRLRAGASVLVDLEGCDRALAGRLTDFASGLAYALGGSLQHVGSTVLLLTPSHMAVSGDELSDIREPGFYNRIRLHRCAPGPRTIRTAPTSAGLRVCRADATVPCSSPAPGQGH